jgi:hypothetical protein
MQDRALKNDTALNATSSAEAFVVSIQSQLAVLPAALYQDFHQASMQGAATSFFLGLTKDQLVKYRCTPTQIKVVEMVIETIIAAYTGSLFSNSAALLTASALEWYGFSPLTCKTGSTVVSSAVSIAQNFTFFGIARTAVGVAGGIAGNAATRWMNDELQTLASMPELDPVKSAKVDAFVQLAYM